MSTLSNVIPIRRPMAGRLTIRLDRRLLTDLRALAVEHDSSAAEVARVLLIQRLDNLAAT